MIGNIATGLAIVALPALIFTFAAWHAKPCPHEHAVPMGDGVARCRVCSEVFEVDQ